MVGTFSSCRNKSRGKTEGGTKKHKVLTHSHNRKNTIRHKYSCMCTHVLACRQSVWLLLTVVPGHSVPEAETCRALHRCGWNELQCVWAPGHRETRGREVVTQKYVLVEENNYSLHRRITKRGYLHTIILCRSLNLAAALFFFLLDLCVGDRSVWRWWDFYLEGAREARNHTYAIRACHFSRHSKSLSRSRHAQVNTTYAQTHISMDIQHNGHNAHSKRHRHTAMFTPCLLSYLFLHAALSLLTLLTSLPLIKGGNEEKKIIIKC